MPLCPTRRFGFAVLTSLMAATAFVPFASAQAQGYGAYITPPRFEIDVKPGERSRQVVEIQHVGRQEGGYRFYTNDWALLPDNSVNFSDELAPGSCRPWVAIERKGIALKPGDKYRYRFEIAPPADTPPTECRFALMVEGTDPAQVNGPIALGVGGRIAVIVYARVGGAAPKLVLQSAETQQVNGAPLATLKVRNEGNAHGRLGGYLSAKDANGQSFEMVATDLPILPGDTRVIGLRPVSNEEGKAAPKVAFPLTVSGELEWDGGKLPVNQTFKP